MSRAVVRCWRAGVSKVYEPYQSSLNTGDFIDINTISSSTKFTETIYEASPLNRVSSVTPPDWFATTTEYGSNAANEVEDYNADELMKVKVTDPNGNKSISFKDKRGRLVLSRRSNNVESTTADTYYKYDHKDQLITVYPPNIYSPASGIKELFQYSYEYDEEGRMTSKYNSDAGRTYMKYDDRDLLVATESSLMRTKQKWLINELDDYGRTTKTGFYNYDPNIGPDFQNLVINNGTLSETYYDGNSDVPAEVISTDIYVGKVRKTIVNILDGFDVGTSFLTNLTNYDSYGRATNSSGNNHLAGTESTTSSYDFADNLLSLNRLHNAFVDINLNETYSYDHKGKQDNINQTILYDNLALSSAHICNLIYDHEDQIVERNLGGISGSTDFLQSVDYSYNEQGWLTQVNEFNLFATESSSSSDDLFGMKLFYNEGLSWDNDPFQGQAVAAQKNGNIARIEWQTADNDISVYAFKYDYLDRLTVANYGKKNNEVYTHTDLYDTNYQYDKRGNLTFLQRKGEYFDKSSNSWIANTVDYLTYTYSIQPQWSNEILSVTDAAITGQVEGVGFESSSSTYDYDAGGNLIEDSGKGIVHIDYNRLNLPYKIQFTGGRSIEWLYDAGGTKLRKTVTSISGAFVVYTQDYVGGIEYKDGAIEAIYHAEGRATLKADNTFQYEYTLKDHLGNNRVTFADLNEDGSATESEILQESHYYPFGLTFDRLSVTNSGTRNDYMYNGKELNDDFDLGWSDYGARMYDATIGRWNGVDPLADEPEQIDKSLYAYAWSNPIRYTDPDGRCPRCLKAIGKTVVKSIAKGKLDLGEVYDIVDNSVTLLSPNSTLLERGEALFNLASPISTKELKAAQNFIEGASDASRGGKKIVYTATDGPVDLNRAPSANSSGGVGGTFVTETDITDPKALLQHTRDNIPPDPFRDGPPKNISTIEASPSVLKPDPTDPKPGIFWIPPRSGGAKVTETHKVVGEDSNFLPIIEKQ